MTTNRLTIIPVDRAVYTDTATLADLPLQDCAIPEDVHALQWKNNSGWIEFTDTRPNEDITILPQWALDCVQVWETAYQQMLDAQALAQELAQTTSEETPPEEPV